MADLWLGAYAIAVGVALLAFSGYAARRPGTLSKLLPFIKEGLSAKQATKDDEPRGLVLLRALGGIFLLAGSVMVAASLLGS